MEKKSKYDTNPLDPDVARRTEDVWGARSTGKAESAGTEEQETATRIINSAPRAEAERRADYETEAPTRRYDEPKFPTSYPSVFVPPAYEPPSAQEKAQGIHGNASSATPPPPQPFMQPPSSRIMPNINLPENVVLMLPYLPFPYVGAVVAAILLYLIPRSEPRARFHASQGLALHAIVVAISLLSGLVEDLLNGPAALTLKIASAAFGVLAFIFFIVSMIRVYKGEPHVVAPVADLTRWLNEKIEPRKN